MKDWIIGSISTVGFLIITYYFFIWLFQLWLS